VVEARDHYEWDERLQDWIDGDLDPSGAAALEAHVAGCSACQARMSGFRALDTTLAKALAPPALSEAFDRRLLEHVDRASTSERTAARARLEREWQAQMRAFSRQWRHALGSMLLNLLLGTALLVALLARLGAPSLVSRLIEQSGQLTHYASLRPASAAMVAVAGLTVAALWLTRALREVH
jgi:anti-sigma factor RsiW